MTLVMIMTLFLQTKRLVVTFHSMPAASSHNIIVLKWCCALSELWMRSPVPTTTSIPCRWTSRKRKIFSPETSSQDNCIWLNEISFPIRCFTWMGKYVSITITTSGTKHFSQVSTFRCHGRVRGQDESQSFHLCVSLLRLSRHSVTGYVCQLLHDRPDPSSPMWLHLALNQCRNFSTQLISLPMHPVINLSYLAWQAWQAWHEPSLYTL